MKMAKNILNIEIEAEKGLDIDYVDPSIWLRVNDETELKLEVLMSNFYFPGIMSDLNEVG